MEELGFDGQSTEPLWIQLRNRLRYLIASGSYEPGRQLPTVRELAQQLDINYNTVSKVYQSLIHEGYIVSRRGKGTFVRDIAEIRTDDQDSPADNVIDLMIDRCLDLGVPLKDIPGQVAKRVALYERDM